MKRFWNLDFRFWIFGILLMAGFSAFGQTTQIFTQAQTTFYVTADHTDLEPYSNPLSMPAGSVRYTLVSVNALGEPTSFTNTTVRMVIRDNTDSNSVGNVVGVPVTESIEGNRVVFSMGSLFAKEYLIEAFRINNANTADELKVASHILTVTNMPAGVTVNVGAPTVAVNLMDIKSASISNSGDMVIGGTLYAGGLEIAGEINGLDATKVSILGETNSVILTNAFVSVDYPTNDFQVANKGYVDSVTGSGGGITNSYGFSVRWTGCPDNFAAQTWAKMTCTVSTVFVFEDDPSNLFSTNTWHFTPTEIGIYGARMWTDDLALSGRFKGWGIFKNGTLMTNDYGIIDQSSGVTAYKGLRGWQIDDSYTAAGQFSDTATFITFKVSEATNIYMFGIYPTVAATNMNRGMIEAWRIGGLQ